MKLVLLFVLATLSSNSLYASDFLSAAFCKPTQEGSVYNSIELFYDDEETGFFIADLLLPDAPAAIRTGVLVKVTDESTHLKVGNNAEAYSIKKNDPTAKFEIDGAEFSCERADW